MSDTPHDQRHYRPSLEDLAVEFPRWHCWQGVNRRWYARLLNSSPPVVIDAEDTIGLYDGISGIESLRDVEPSEAKLLNATLDGILSDLQYIRSLPSIAPQKSGQVAAMLGRLSYELRCAEDMLP
jgi:hypothetical protein